MSLNRTGKTWCRHYRSMQNDDCRIGIRYDSVRPEPKEGIKLEMPCWGGELGGCPKYSGYTPEEIAEQDRKIEENFQRTNIARKAVVARAFELGFIRDSGGRRGKSVRGSLPCPICNLGTLSFSRAACNGHVHAACSTPSCVRWLE